MQPLKQTKKVAYQDEVQDKISQGLEKLSNVAKAAYGPRAGNALVEQQYGDPLLSRDGVSNVKKVYLEDPIENMAARVAVQASEQNNKKVGDGTTAVVILANYLYKEARKMLAGGINRMVIADQLEETARNIIAIIDQIKIPADDTILQQVAMVSSGNNAIGEMIAASIKEVGIDGGINVEEFAGIGTVNELVEGFFFQKGWTNINLINDPSNLESRHDKVMLLITDKRFATGAELVPILEKIVEAGITELVIIGEVADEALNVLLLNKLKGIIACSVADLPVFAGSKSLMLDDLALITGGKVLTNGAKPSAFNVNMLGAADKVIINEWSTTIMGADGDGENTSIRIAELREQLAETPNPMTAEALRDRLAKLTGKVSIIRVGGATDIERKELKLRVEDAICAVRAAIKEGVVPGGGVTLARIAHDSNSLPFIDAYSELFKQLANNAGLNAERYLAKVEDAKEWYGYDLRAVGDKPINLLKAGIVDPALVIKEVVRNATSVVSRLITTTVAITYEDRSQKND